MVPEVGGKIFNLFTRTHTHTDEKWGREAQDKSSTEDD
jgi:hypothetical protein